MKTELISGLPFADYQAILAISQSGLKAMARSPGYYKHRRDHPAAPTPVMEFGSAVDCIVSGEDFNAQFIVRPPGMDLRTRDGKAWAKEAGDRIIVPQEVYTCAGAVMREAGRYFTGGEAQLSGVWQDEETGEWLKMRLDYYREELHIVELKTTDDASPDSFARKAFNLKYHWQAAVYCDGVTAITGEPNDAFTFVVAERDPPHRVEVYEVPMSILEQGRAEYREALKLYAQCKNRDEWPASTGVVHALEFAAWMMR